AADNCTVHLVDEAEQVLHLAKHRHVDEATAAKAQTARLADSVLARAAAERQEPVVVPAGDPRLRPQMQGGFEAPRTAVAVAVPLMIGGRLIGLLSMGFQAPREIQRSTLLTLMAIGEQEAIAIDRARSHALLERRAHLSALLRRTAEQVVTAGGGVDAEAILD